MDFKAALFSEGDWLGCGILVMAVSFVVPLMTNVRSIRGIAQLANVPLGCQGKRHPVAKLVLHIEGLIQRAVGPNVAFEFIRAVEFNYVVAVARKLTL
ncbi:MAG: hypothetical protein FGM15_03395 [Chthoniobacterales bacterium]|nr:hypothetical protein [Chthoniobacterales bacterium]